LVILSLDILSIGYFIIEYFVPIPLNRLWWGSTDWKKRLLLKAQPKTLRAVSDSSQAVWRKARQHRYDVGCYHYYYVVSAGIAHVRGDLKSVTVEVGTLWMLCKDEGNNKLFYAYSMFLESLEKLITKCVWYRWEKSVQFSRKTHNFYIIGANQWNPIDFKLCIITGIIIRSRTASLVSDMSVRYVIFRDGFLVLLNIF
jgi:hypothetical protein